MKTKIALLILIAVVLSALLVQPSYASKCTVSGPYPYSSYSLPYAGLYKTSVYTPKDYVSVVYAQTQGYVIYMTKDYTASTLTYPNSLTVKEVLKFRLVDAHVVFTFVTTYNPITKTYSTKTSVSCK